MKQLSRIVAVLIALELAFTPPARAQLSSPKSSTAQVSGRVIRSDNGEPIAKAQVSLGAADTETGELLGSERVVRTGADGTFRIGELPAGTFNVLAWRNGYSQAPRTEYDPRNLITLKSGAKLENLTLRLHPTGVIAGQVVDEDQEPVNGVQVTALRIEYQPGGKKHVVEAGGTSSDDLGNFRISGLPPGTYYVGSGGSVQVPMMAVQLKQGPSGGMHYRNTFYPGTSSLDDAQPLKVGAEQTTNDVRLMLPTERTYSITGNVLAPPEVSLTDAEVSWERLDQAGYTFQAGSWTAPIEADHSFRYSAVYPGDYRLNVRQVIDGRQTDLGFASVRVVDSNVRTNIEVGRGAEIHGRVQASGKLPVAGLKLSLEIFDSGFNLLHQSPALDASGRFSIANLPPGSYTFNVFTRADAQTVYVKNALCNGRDYAKGELSLAIGSSIDCDVTLAGNTGGFHGDVADGKNPAQRAVVVLIPESADLRRIPRYTQAVETDASGKYRLAGVVPGDYLLFAVPQNPERSYYALDFADRHADVAEHVTVTSSATASVNLKVENVE